MNLMYFPLGAYYAMQVRSMSCNPMHSIVTDPYVSSPYSPVHHGKTITLKMMKKTTKKLVNFIKNDEEMNSSEYIVDFPASMLWASKKQQKIFGLKNSQVHQSTPGRLEVHQRQP